MPCLNIKAQGGLINPFAPNNPILNMDVPKNYRLGLPQDILLSEAIDPRFCYYPPYILSESRVDKKIFNQIYNQPKIDEEKKWRQEWEKAFNIDVWYPYYKTKDVEKWVKKRLSIKIFKLKGEPQFERKHFYYTFTAKF
jgi:hypothetical protein